MNYKKVYDHIIENRKQNTVDGYTENHHIIPRSLGGTDEEINLIRLTAREHFLCHYLLAKMYKKETFEWYKMNNAFLMMKCSSLTQNRYFSSRLYEALKTNRSTVMSKNQSGKGNSQYGSLWICNIELQKNRKIGKNESIPEGWVHGRNKWKRIKEKMCINCGNFFISTYSKYCSKECRPSTKGYTLSEETRKKMSDIKKELYKDKTKNPAFGREFSHTEESKCKISRSLKKLCGVS